MRLSKAGTGGIGALLVFLTLGLLATAAMPRVALADGEVPDDDDVGECRPACRDVRGACKESARTAMRSCKEDCRAARMPEACYRSCRDDHATTRSVCREDCRACREECDDDGTPSDCERGCVAALRECMADVRGGGRACVNECTDGMRDRLFACFEAENPVLCLLQSARELSECLGDCADDMRVAAEGCVQASRECKETCAVGSASRAFLDPPSTLLD